MRLATPVYRCLITLCGLGLLASSATAQPASTPQPTTQPARTLEGARKGFKTTLTRQLHENEAPLVPPAALFQLVAYESPVGKLAAYVSTPPADAKKHPAILWITGGFSSSIDDTPWADAPASNDQSARAFREAGLVMMYPSLRGGNKNPGYKEVCFGEVDDVLAATDYLARQPFVDAQRIYLGGHSTGGTLAMLVAERSDRYRAVLSFGPVSTVAGYGAASLPFDVASKMELIVRAPIVFLRTVQSPLYVFEGTERSSNIASLRQMAKAPHNDKVEFHEIPEFNHFSVLAPATKVLAAKIKADDGTAGARLHFDNSDFARK